MYKTNATVNRTDGTYWELRDNQVTCDSVPVCTLVVVDGHWRISGDEQYRFGTQLDAFYYVMDRCV